MRRFLLIVLFVLLVALPRFSAAQVLYSVTDLGTPSGYSASYATAINANGQVVGYADQNGYGVTHAVLYSNGTMTDLGASWGGTYSSLSTHATAINNNGQVVGWANGPGDNSDIAFEYINESMQDISGIYGSNLKFTRAYGINDNGQVVGYSGSFAILVSTKAPSDILSLLTDGYATAINNNGQIVGSKNYDSFLWQENIAMQTISGGDMGATYALAISNNGQVAGSFSFGTVPTQHAFLWQSGIGLHDLGTLGGDNSIAKGVNDNGQVVGYDAEVKHAFLWQDGVGMQDLNSLIDPASGWTLQNASGINDNGQIVGYGLNSAGQTHAFLLTPVPEPATITLLCIGAFGLIAYAWRRRKA